LTMIDGETLEETVYQLEFIDEPDVNGVRAVPSFDFPIRNFTFTPIGASILACP